MMTETACPFFCSKTAILFFFFQKLLQAVYLKTELFLIAG